MNEATVGKSRVKLGSGNKSGTHFFSDISRAKALATAP